MPQQEDKYATGQKATNLVNEEELVWPIGYGWGAPNTLPAGDLLTNLRVAITHEDREDLHISVADTTVHEDGTLRLVNDTPFLIERKAFYQLCSRTIDCALSKPRGFPGYAVSSTAEERARAFMYWKQNVALPLVFRTRTDGDDKVIYAVVTPSYTIIDGDFIAEVAMDCLEDSDYSGSGWYDGRGFTTRMRSSEIVSAGNSRIMSGLGIRTADDGGGSIHIDNLVCHAANGAYTRLPASLMPSLRRVHRGKEDTVIDILVDGLARSVTAVNTFRQILEAAEAEQVISSAEEAKTAFEKLTTNKAEWRGKVRNVTPLLSAPGLSQNRLAELLLEQWIASQGFSRAHIYNSVVRLIGSHGLWPSGLPSIDAQYALEMQAQVVLLPSTEL